MAPTSFCHRDLSRQLGILTNWHCFPPRKLAQDLTYAETPRYKMVKTYTAHDLIQKVHMKPTPSKPQQALNSKKKQILINGLKNRKNNENREKQKTRENVQ